jgi:hypothetical protein
VKRQPTPQAHRSGIEVIDPRRYAEYRLDQASIAVGETITQRDQRWLLS